MMERSISDIYDPPKQPQPQPQPAMTQEDAPDLPPAPAPTRKPRRPPPPPPKDDADDGLDLNADWTHHDPPPALRTNLLEDAPAELIALVPQSVDNVVARIRVQHTRAADEEALRAAAERDRRLADGPYLPIIIVPARQALPSSTPSSSTSSILSPPARTAADGLLSASLLSTAAADQLAAAKRRLRHRFRLHFFVKPSNSSEGSAASPLWNSGGKQNDKKEFQSSKKWQKLSALPVVVEMVECVSCLDDFPATTRGVVKLTCHSYCGECFVRLIQTSMQNEVQFPPKCCLNPVPFATVLRHLPKNLHKTFHNRADEWDVPAAERVYCAHRNCSLWIRPSQVNIGLQQARCSDGHDNCTICREVAHDGQDCPRDRDMVLTQELAESEGWKQCQCCHALVEHREACQHMTCRCGFEFCYVCNTVWHTCTCTSMQLEALKAAATIRREARRLREAQDEADLREALRQIAEFEAEEARRVELLRREQERLEAGRRQHELDERIFRETARRENLHRRYSILRDRLPGLHALQEAAVAADLDARATIMAHDEDNTLRDLRARHIKDRAALDNEEAAEIAALEAKFNHDLATRVDEEQRIEHDYEQRLRAHYRQVPVSSSASPSWQSSSANPAPASTGTAVPLALGESMPTDPVQAAMRPLRKRMDDGFRAWQQRHDQAVASLRDAAAERRQFREEAAWSRERRAEDDFITRRRALDRYRLACATWLPVVFAERTRLLAEAEHDELVRDADSLFDEVFGPESESELDPPAAVLASTSTTASTPMHTPPTSPNSPTSASTPTPKPALSTPIPKFGSASSTSKSIGIAL